MFDKTHTLRTTDKELVYIEEYEDKYILYHDIDGYCHGGIRISKITFECNASLDDLINYLKYVLHFKEEELKILEDE